jgi:hypothetical protein
MTVVVSCNLPDGVVLGVDSAVTIPVPFRGPKVYENAEKLFQIGELPIGVAVYGLATLGGRSIGSYIRQFEIDNPDGVLTRTSMESIVKKLSEYLMDAYKVEIIPAIEKAKGKKFDQIDVNDVPMIGLVLGGFSKKSYLSEVWEIQIPYQAEKPLLKRAQGNFGANAFSLNRPILRYMLGYDESLLDALLARIEDFRKEPFSEEEHNAIDDILWDYAYMIPYSGMSIMEGVDYTRFLVELAINHYRFAAGTESVGGRVNIGKVTYKGEKFKILDAGVWC